LCKYARYRLFQFVALTKWTALSLERATKILNLVNKRKNLFSHSKLTKYILLNISFCNLNCYKHKG
jgi:hypothetical protein